MINVNAVGDACPIPVVKTKDAIRTLGEQGGQVRTLVDNEIAVQNLSKMAAQKKWDCKSEKLSDGNFAVTITVGQGGTDVSDIPETCSPEAAPGKKRTVVVFDAGVVGDGVETLGRVLMKSFTFALTKQETPPSAIICYNGGAYLTCEGSEVIEDLKTLERAGTEVYTCGTCLDFYGLKEKLLIGSISNMYAIAEMMLTADLVLHP